MRDTWAIFDRRSDARMGVSTFPTRELAEWQITNWQNRHDHGGRPDITLDMLLNMEPRQLSHDARPEES